MYLEFVVFYVMAKKKTILFIDDEQGIRQVIAGYFELLDSYNVIFADDALLGLQIFAVNQVDAIITDISMPRHDGKELIEALHESGRQVPIAVISNLGEYLSDDPTIQRAKMILPKPISFEDFALALVKLSNPEA